MIKNLNQLKRRLRPGTRLEVTGHCRPGCIGQLREVTWVNTQGVYTKILNPPDPRINAANDGIPIPRNACYHSSTLQPAPGHLRTVSAVHI